jgi:hypothetical protein
MKPNKKWRKLGWRHPLWDFIRFYSVVQRQRKELRIVWEERLRQATLQIDASQSLPIRPEDATLFFDYLRLREPDFTHATANLRTETEAVAFCESLGVAVTRVKTKSADHHQSSAALVGAVNALTIRRCQVKGSTYTINPDRRCVWLVNDHLHVTARNLDGAVPSLVSPSVVWEIKEYWGPTGGGSKMSDALYECNLVGREMREFEERSGAKIMHVVFLDGRDQWATRQSDLKRFIDLFHQGIIDHLLIGKEVETDWESLLAGALK